MNNITIRIAEKKDAEMIADLSRQTFYETFAAQNKKEDMEKFLSEQFTKKALIEEVSAPGNTFLLAFAGNEVAGYARLREGNAPANMDNGSSMELARLYALKSMIGKGVGSALMQACINLAKEANKKIVWLGVWEKNQRAIDFYTKWGYQKFDEHDFILGNDVQRDWMMKKEL